MEDFSSIFLGLYFGFFAVVIVMALISLVGIAKMFEKAGYSWWKALIPIYNIYIIHIITFPKDKAPFMLALFVPGVNIIYEVYLYYQFFATFTTKPLIAVLSVICPAIGAIYLGFTDKGQYTGRKTFIL